MDFAGKEYSLQRPQVMGVINATPDSFSDGGTLFQSQRLNLSAAIDRAAEMTVAGATFLDVGGESTRPGARAVDVAEELERVIPVIAALRQRFDVVVSVDTSSAQVMTEAATAGAGLINDVRALQRDGALEAAAATGLPICLMHIKGEPKTMQKAPHYDDLMGEIAAYFEERISACQHYSIDPQNIILDPGFGFGKTLDHNLELLKRLHELQIFHMPLLVGMSRKSMIGNVLDKSVDQRLYGGLAVAVLAMERGATIIRSHDVGPTVDAMRMAHAVLC